MGIGVRLCIRFLPKGGGMEVVPGCWETDDDGL
jgi:hypothetical protein